MKNLFVFFLVAIVSFKFTYSQEEIDKNPILTDKFHIDAGAFFPAKKVKFGADASSPNDLINFSDSFDFNDNEITPYLKFDWRFAKKWKLTGEFFRIINAQKAELKEDVVFEDIIFKQGTFVRAGFGFNLYRVYVGRSFSRGFKHEFGGGIGVHALNTTAFIEGEVLVNEEDFVFEKRKVSALLPLPNIGLWYYYTPNAKWTLVASVDWFAITIGEYSGGLLDIVPGIKYQVFKNIGIGLDYRYFNVYAKLDQSNWKGKFDMSFQGPMVSINANF